jgi:hypothetical protein
MSSCVETLGWQAKYELGRYDWQGWIEHAKDLLPLPVYDLSKILDTSAAWDIFYHARHWPDDRAHELRPVHVPAGLVAAIAHAGIEHMHQVQYVARALYNHCARYTRGMPNVRAVPIDHMLSLRVVPSAVFKSLVVAIKADTAAARRLDCWLQNVIMWHSSRPATIMTTMAPELHHRRGRRIGRGDAAVDTETAQARINRILSGITDHHETLPTLWCTVTAVRIGAGRVSIVLCARQPALSDE